MTDAKEKPPYLPPPQQGASETQSSNAPELSSRSVEEIQRLIHELRVHQIELELQNQELRTAQIALEESRDKYVDLYNGAPVAYFTTDYKGLILEANLKAAQFLGIGRRQLVGLPLARFFRQEDADLWHLQLREVFETGSRQTRELRFLKSGGSEFYGRVESLAVRDSGGRLDRCRTIVSDITDRKLAEEECRQIEERFRNIFEQSPLGMAIVGPTCRFLAVNDALAGLLGYSKEEINKLTLADIIPPEDIKQEAKRLQGLSEGSVPLYRTEKRYIKKTGETLWTRVSVSAVRDQTGKDFYFLAMVEDMTDLKKAEELLIRTSRLEAVADLARGVAHNFNNLLQVVMGTLELVLVDLELGDSSDLENNLGHVLERSRAAAELVKRLQSFAHERGEIPLSESKVFDLSTVVRNAADMAEQWWTASADRQEIGVSLTLDLADECFVKGQDTALFEVATNLIKNAVESLSGSGNIAVATRVHERQVILEVKDDGIGIPAEYLGKVFEPFWSGKGLIRPGMGLAVAYGIVNWHNGTISVKSTQKEGSTFTVNLPLSDRPPQGVKESIALSPIDTKLSILVIDDAEPVLDFLKTALAKFGFTVLAALSGPEALRVFKDNQVDLVICDLAMPGMTGWEVGRDVREICREKGLAKAPFILLTGWGGQTLDEEKMVDSGVDGTVEKPVKISKLLRTIQEVANQVSVGHAR